MILHLTVRLLDNRFHGRTDGNEPEWPPSPFRVFQALLAGAKCAWSDQQEQAFQWLESLPPPIIHAPGPRLANPLLVWVPNNDKEHARTQKTIRPQVLPGPRQDWRIDYFWTADDSPDALPHAEAIVQCARHIRCLGWGIDMAIGTGRVINALPDPPSGFQVHVPAKAARSGNPLRVPCDTSLKSLEDAHAAFLDRIRIDHDTGKEVIHDDPGKKRFDIGMYGSSPPRPFCAFEFCTPDEDETPYSFNPRRIKQLVGMIRGLMNTPAVHKALGEKMVNRMLLGHDNDNPGPRLSIMPLLSVGHPHADALVRRLILAEPFSGDGSVCHLLAELLDGKNLMPDRSDQPVVQLRRLPQHDRYVRRWYAGCACQWASVSPVLLPGFDHPRSNSGTKALERAEKLVLKALAHADITSQCRVEISPLSWWPNVPHARDFIPRDKLGPAPRYHIKLIFDQPFTGPLSLGRQRHTGLGVFAALDHEPADRR